MVWRINFLSDLIKHINIPSRSLWTWHLFMTLNHFPTLRHFFQWAQSDARQADPNWLHLHLTVTHMNPCFIWVGLIGIPCSLCLRSQSIYFLSTVSPSRECLSSCCPDRADFIFRSSSNINTFWKLPDYAGISQFCFLPRTMSMRYDVLKNNADDVSWSRTCLVWYYMRVSESFVIDYHSHVGTII